MSTRWEYKVLTYKVGWKGFDYDQIEKSMNELGSQGWETISTISPSFGGGQSLEVAVTLKRAVG